MENVKRKKATADKPNYLGLVFALIPLAGFAFFSLFPAVFSLLISFADVGQVNMGAGINWGTNPFENYITALAPSPETPAREAAFWASIGSSALMCCSQFISLATAVVISVALSKKVKGQTFFTVVFFIPYICSSIALTTMWDQVFALDGIINTVVGSMTGYQDPTDPTIVAVPFAWLSISTNPPFIFILVMWIIIAWQAAGYGIVILGAALAAVDKTLYEAADLDGAGTFTTFFRITVPTISPTIYFLLTLGLINGMQIFEIPYMFKSWDGMTIGPGDIGRTTTILIYQLASTEGNSASLACAMSWLMFIILFAAQRLNEWLSKRWVHAE